MTLAERGHRPPERPDQLARHGRRAAAAGGHAGRRLHRRRDPPPGRAGDHRRARHADLQRGPRAHERARPRARRATGIEEGDGVAIMCRNHRGFIDATVACSKLGANALYLNTAFAGPQITDVVKREKPCDHLRRGVRRVLADAGEAPQALHRLVRRPGASADGPDARGPDRPRRPVDAARAAARAGPRVILTSGTTGTPKGASRKQPESLDPAAALFEGSRCRRARRR